MAVLLSVISSGQYVVRLYVLLARGECRLGFRAIRGVSPVEAGRKQGELIILCLCPRTVAQAVANVSSCDT